VNKIEELKRWYECKREGRTEEYKTYKTHLKSKKSDIERFKGYITDAKIKLEETKLRFPETSKECKDAKDQVERWKHSLKATELALKFMRPNIPEDIEYRNTHGGEDFVRKLQEIASPNLDLRFHGTPIYFAEQIIKSGEISSTADRYDGYIKSTDMKGEISASTIKSVNRTIDFFSDMASYMHSLPAGCIFAILPKDQADANYGPDLLHSVNLKENPEQLFGLITTPENIEQVTNWMKESGFQDKGVYTFEGFLEAVKEKSQIIDNQLGREKSNISYKQKENDYLFEEEEVKEIATSKDIRIGRINKLQEKIKNRNKLENLKGREENQNSEPSRD